MPKRNSDVAHRAWKLLRLALLWARKGGIFKGRLMMELRVPKFLTSLGYSTPRGQFFYGERELSFDKTPIFHFKARRPASKWFNIPCLTPQTDFDYDFDEESLEQIGRKSFLTYGDEEGEYGYEVCEVKTPVDEEGIDLRAEKFIAQFYEQIRLQRQISYLEHQ
ncbi:hypothetical protein K2173_010240 [Erythroxylum novogranatense]|uniref:Uncharacterized protein n=1 Tax=Erythroxylum novogranatense TaxID=1862640 RepID=A0AAV8UCN6_9ROSI|nr:hypothetical protein K2173_010240 [Erythroxylum novogranatense]